MDFLHFDKEVLVRDVTDKGEEEKEDEKEEEESDTKKDRKRRKAVSAKEGDADADTSQNYEDRHFNVKQMLKETRDIWCHDSAVDREDDSMAKEVDRLFKWFPMHCFMVRELTKGNSPLRKFAEAHQEEETRQCQAELAQDEAREIAQKVDNLFVKVIDEDKGDVRVMQYWQKSAGLQALRKEAKVAKNQCLVYIEPGTKRRIPIRAKNLSKFEKSLQKEPASDKSRLDPWATHEFVIKESDDTKDFPVQVVDQTGHKYLHEDWKKEYDLDILRRTAGIKGNQCLIYTGPCAKDLVPIQVSNKIKTLFALEAFLRKEMSDDQFELKSEVIHEFSIFEKTEAKPVTGSESDDEFVGLALMPF